MVEHAHHTIVAEFGTKLGESQGIAGYSNQCHVSYDGEKVYTGILGQCVEYARRFMITTRGITFGNINCAHHIWEDLPPFTDLKTKQELVVRRFTTGLKIEEADADYNPKIGDLVIWPREEKEIPWGHVAVICGVEEGHVLIAEQNWPNEKEWHGGFSRKFETKVIDGHFHMYDDEGSAIYGWMRCNDPTQ